MDEAARRSESGRHQSFAISGRYLNPRGATEDRAKHPSCYAVVMGDGSVASGATHRTSVSSSAGAAAIGTTFAVILSLSFCHLLNDLMQSLVPALYPILKSSYGLSF